MENLAEILIPVFVVSTILGMICALTLHPMIIFYEIRGGDPLKRSVLNQLLSMLSLFVIFANLLLSPSLLIRFFTLTHLADWHAWIVFRTIKGMLIQFGTLTLWEFVLCRYLSICIYQGPLPINDQFFGKMLFTNNVVLAAFLTGVQCFGAPSGDLIMTFLTGTSYTTGDPSLPKIWLVKKPLILP